jgi:hypothetical protein
MLFAVCFLFLFIVHCWSLKCSCFFSLRYFSFCFSVFCFRYLYLLFVFLIFFYTLSFLLCAMCLLSLSLSPVPFPFLNFEKGTCTLGLFFFVCFGLRFTVVPMFGNSHSQHLVNQAHGWRGRAHGEVKSESESESKPSRADWQLPDLTEVLLQSAHGPKLATSQSHFDRFRTCRSFSDREPFHLGQHGPLQPSI